MLCWKKGESTSLQVKSQHWGVHCQISTEGVALDYFNNDKIVIKVNP